MENNARSTILNAVNLANAGIEKSELLNSDIAGIHYDDAVARFMTVLEDIGGKAIRVSTMDEAQKKIESMFDVSGMCVISTCFNKDSAQMREDRDFALSEYNDVDLFITTSELGIAENGAVWLDESKMPDRILPFIAENLVVILSNEAIVQNMHIAYDKQGEGGDGFGVFIAGPSKTADIEQSLVLGAHGARTMTVIVVGE